MGTGTTIPKRSVVGLLDGEQRVQRVIEVILERHVDANLVTSMDFRVDGELYIYFADVWANDTVIHPDGTMEDVIAGSESGRMSDGATAICSFLMAMDW